MNFIELTRDNGDKMIGNINLLQRVENIDGKCFVVGWNPNGFWVKETYEEIIKKIDARLAKVNRF